VNEEADQLFQALPDPCVLVADGRVVAVNAALLALVGETAPDSVELAELIAEDRDWVAERARQAYVNGETLRLHVRARTRSVPVDLRVGKTETGRWILIGRDATPAERVGSVVGRLSSIYARVPQIDTLGALFAQSQSLFDALGWTVALFRVEGEDVVLQDVWLSEQLREHPSGFGRTIDEQLRDRRLPRRMSLERVPFIRAAAVEGRGSTIDDFPPLAKRAIELLGFEAPQLERGLLVDLGLARGATAPVFSGDRVSHVVSVTSSAFDERDSASLQLFASTLSSVLRMNELGAEMGRQQRHAALGQMSRQLAHEVRNPLAVILQASRQARKEGGAPARAKLLDMIDEEAGRLERLMADLVSFAGPLTLRLRRTSVRDLVRWSLDALAERERHPRVAIEVDPAVAVQADPMLFRQALTHILANACSHAQDRVHVSAESDGDRVLLRIENDGGPIPEAVAERVFEPFFSTRPTGTGLGLAVVRRLIEDQGGTVRLERGADATVFLVDLPAAGVADRGAVSS